MLIDYKSFASKIDIKLMIQYDGEWVYLLYPDPPKNGNILFQEKKGRLILWSNEYKEKTKEQFYKILLKELSVDLIVPYVETKVEYDLLLGFGAIPIEYEDENDEGCSKEFGSLLIKNN